MKSWIKRTLIGLFGAGVLFGALAACSHRHHGHGYAQMSEADVAKLRERFIDKATRELTLDDAQRAKLGALADVMQTQRAALLAPGGAAANPRAELQSLVAGAQFDRSKAQGLIDSKTSAVRDKAPAVMAAVADFYDSLKPDQQQKVRDFMSRGRSQHGWRG